ncbi:SCP2 sterol-binding domain-containing protein [Micromonospora sp. PLK6-60]|uniref:SCP2 sterol-binding domain-containing protein n=1 Tax=Micromonospora sp. PLK6-60 TaxID=2873383 RepID=UPI0035AC0200
MMDLRTVGPAHSFVLHGSGEMVVKVMPSEDRAAFARWVQQASDDELKELLAQSRADVLTALVEGMPDVFRADRAGTLDVVVHWRVTGRPDGDADVFELRIAEGRCVVVPPETPAPQLVLTLDPVNFVKMTTGNANARMLFLRGRLRARGDLGLVNRFPSLFDVPKP